eukprot:6113770-Pyramimonas_sp.AAC.1
MCPLPSLVLPPLLLRTAPARSSWRARRPLPQTGSDTPPARCGIARQTCGQDGDVKGRRNGDVKGEER